MKAKRLTMDTDYNDMAYIGKGSPSDIEELFDRMAGAGFDATIWDVFLCGKAMYHSDKYPVFKNRIGMESARNLAEHLRHWDPLAKAVNVGKERNIKVMAYFRMLEEAYAPFDGHDFFQKNPEYWWQSRCGQYRIVGWPCYAYPEVREHMLERVRDLVDHGIDGALFDICRTHIPYFSAYSWGDGNVFGFNQPIVEEFKRRYGVDLSTYDYIEDGATINHGDLPFTYEKKWIGTEPYDIWALRRLVGEGFELFIREVRKRFPQLYIAVQAGLLGGGGYPDESLDQSCFRMDVEALCAEKIIDEYSQPMDYGKKDINSILLPRYDHVLKNGTQLTAWLNDILHPTGGGDCSGDDNELTNYVDRCLASNIDGFMIHEAAFIQERKNRDDAWKQISRLKGG